MRIGVCFPTIALQKAAETIGRWRAKGFVPLIMVNNVPGAKFPEGCGAIKKDSYEGYARECNLLCHILFDEAKCDVVICGSDGIWPDPDLEASSAGALLASKFPNGVGVVQPVWDKFEGSSGACWGPWIGRGFYNTFYSGQGPYCSEYFQYFMGSELYDFAKKEGVLFETDAIHQYFHHYSRTGGPKPDFFQNHNRGAYLESDRSTYYHRKKNGFPGSGKQGKLFLPEHHGRIILPSEL